MCVCVYVCNFSSVPVCALTDTAQRSDVARAHTNLTHTHMASANSLSLSLSLPPSLPPSLFSLSLSLSLCTPSLYLSLSPSLTLALTQATGISFPVAQVPSVDRRPITSINTPKSLPLNPISPPH